MKTKAIGQEEETEVIMTGESAAETYKKLLEMEEKEANANKTRFEVITASPEALAEWLEESIGSFCDTYNGEVDCEKCPIADDCDVIEQKRLKQLRDNSTDNISISDKDYWLAWLKQESEE